VERGLVMKIEIDSQLLEEITLAQLQQSLAGLRDSYEDRKDGGDINFFSDDRKEDLKEIKRHIEAFEIVASYYQVPS
jgi:hypothetical protein